VIAMVERGVRQSARLESLEKRIVVHSLKARRMVSRIGSYHPEVQPGSRFEAERANPLTGVDALALQNVAIACSTPPT
jgi:hypothetical protein